MDLGELLEQMNRALPRIRRHHNRGIMYESRYAPTAHCVIDLNPEEIDREDAPETLHAEAPREG